MKRRIITLCGSTRFEKIFHKVNEHFTLLGDIVISRGVFGHTMSKEHRETILSVEKKKELDTLHLAKIDMSDTIFVIDCDGYIGESTKREITYAQEKGKTIMYLSVLRKMAEKSSTNTLYKG